METKATVWTPLVSNSTSDGRGILISVTLARKNITAREVIDAIHPHGTALVMEDGKAWVRETAIPPELLMQALKANREAVLAEMKRRADVCQDRRPGPRKLGDFAVSGAVLSSQRSYLLLPGATLAGNPGYTSRLWLWVGVSCFNA